MTAAAAAGVSLDVLMAQARQTVSQMHALEGMAAAHEARGDHAAAAAARAQAAAAHDAAVALAVQAYPGQCLTGLLMSTVPEAADEDADGLP